MSDATILDDPEARARLDPSGMGAAVRGLPDQCRAAWDEARRLELPAAYREIDRVIHAVERYKRPGYIELPADMVGVARRHEHRLLVSSDHTLVAVDVAAYDGRARGHRL